jgi:Mn-dependent DtxR family transcriptional regulator
MHNMSESTNKLVRKFIYDFFMENARAPFVEEIAAKFDISKRETEETLRELDRNHLLVLVPNTHRILMANPFSNLPTIFLVSSTKEGRTQVLW